ncbi:STAS domain-containing protein [Waterburya agarophytonicola K14]|uniref:Anti-sigma factor antagonist n=1 Tax=Waterburya agarophytonicola KI4 TaxID=2874699 RepID=A0A964BNA5_9CYAN|nr:STAS domain-containing protein [Waterburya agarophytonicola]MCC0175478.1 STAS domain-containing protein [Waterburya agarophytonicola KI4]
MNSVVQIIEPEGILDGTKTDDFQHQLDRSINSGVQAILVDFSNVTFMDSSGLGALVKALKSLKAAEVDLFLCSINDQIKMLFELTSMDEYFTILDNRAEFNQQLQK